MAGGFNDTIVICYDVAESLALKHAPKRLLWHSPIMAGSLHVIGVDFQRQPVGSANRGGGSTSLRPRGHRHGGKPNNDANHR